MNDNKQHHPSTSIHKLNVNSNYIQIFLYLKIDCNSNNNYKESKNLPNTRHLE